MKNALVKEEAKKEPYHMFVTGEVFNPSDLYKVDIPQEMVEKQKEKAIKQAAKRLISLGLIKATDISVESPFFEVLYQKEISKYIFM